MGRAFITSIIIFIFIAQYSLAQIPQTMSYQGLLTGTSDTPVKDGNYSLTFRLYNIDVGGAALWTEAYPSVAVIKGIFNVILGSSAPLTLPFDQQYWLGITVGAGPELSPRIKLTSSAYSLNARLADNSVTAAKIQPNIVSSVDGIINDGGNIDLMSQNAITISPDAIAKTITVGESHSARTDNPHKTAASQLSAWGLTGNSGTTPGTNFLGTTDNNALEFKVNNTRVLRFEPQATSPNILGGFSGNSITPGVYGATISGGGTGGNINLVTDIYGTVGGGARNQAGDNIGTIFDRSFATVGGGGGNQATGTYSTVGGGGSNQATGTDSTVGGGYNNKATEGSSTVGGGGGNQVTGAHSTIGGGYYNKATGLYSTVPGGVNNEANGNYSFAAGCLAHANAVGSFVWGDSTVADVASAVVNRWTARASGGVYFYTNAGLASGSYLAAGGNSWNAISDKAGKENYAPVDSLSILERLASMPIQEYNLKSQESSIRHIGPVAQDFASAFRYGESDTAINMEDADGVAFAAIQGLYKMVQEKDTKIASQQQQITALESRLVALEKLVSPWR